MKCSHCQRDVSEKDSFTHLSETLCEDCYMDIRFQAKACDPWAVYSATRTREQVGLKGAEGLNDLQKEIFTFITKSEKATFDEIMKKFGLSIKEMQTQMAVLRHCELVRGQKEGDKVYLVPF